jgi:hypothetical protein
MMLAEARTHWPVQEREALYRKLRHLIVPQPTLDRSLVSFQASRKNAQYGWFKYKEGFSAQLVEYLIRRSGRSPGVLLDPFAGAGTALLVGRSLGWRCLGVEVLPVGPAILEAWLAGERVSLPVLKRHIAIVASGAWPERSSEDCALRHIPITAGAFPPVPRKRRAHARPLSGLLAVRARLHGEFRGIRHTSLVQPAVECARNSPDFPRPAIHHLCRRRSHGPGIRPNVRPSPHITCAAAADMSRRFAGLWAPERNRRPRAPISHFRHGGLKWAEKTRKTCAPLLGRFAVAGRRGPNSRRNGASSRLPPPLSGVQDRRDGASASNGPLLGRFAAPVSLPEETREISSAPVSHFRQAGASPRRKWESFCEPLLGRFAAPAPLSEEDEKVPARPY